MFILLAVLLILFCYITIKNIDTWVFSSSDSKRGSTHNKRLDAVIDLNDKSKDKNYLRESLQFNQKEINKCRREYNNPIKELRRMDPFEFEHEIINMYREFGWYVHPTPRSNDGGKDAIMSRDNLKFLLECKRYNAERSIGRPDIQKFHSAIIDCNADDGFFVTTIHFTPAAIDYARRNGVTLIDSERLSELYRSAYSVGLDHTKSMCRKCGYIATFDFSLNPSYKKCPNGHSVKNLYRSIAKPFVGQASNDLNCSLCGSKMILRKGKNKKFWGCSSYPNCTFTMSH